MITLRAIIRISLRGGHVYKTRQDKSALWLLFTQYLAVFKERDISFLSRLVDLHAIDENSLIT